jgi:endo-1,4-beta-D-glucanase Y
VSNYYFYWKARYLAPSTKVAGDYKVNYDGKGTTVSEAIGYGMLLTVYMADADKNAKACFDGLNRFRKRYPSSINPAFMCWKIPANEKAVSGDCATDGDLDMALALLLAHQQWGEAAYLKEATDLIHHIGATLVRPDFSLRLGDWNTEPGQTRPSDFMPTHFRAFHEATGDKLWTSVESRCYAIIDELQTNSAPATGLVPDFAISEDGHWKPANPKFMESRHDGEFNYNSCRVPWRIGWAATSTGDARARRILERFMKWAIAHADEPEDFRAGYQLDGTNPGNCDFDTACFISPTGVAAMATGNQRWFNQTFAYALKRRENYYEDTVNLLCMLVMSGKAWLPIPDQDLIGAHPVAEQPGSSE